MCRVHAFQEVASSKCINSLLLLYFVQGWIQDFLREGSNLQRGFNLLNFPDNLLIFPDFSENSP